MLARRYEAPTLDAALALVHEDLGDDAVILYTRAPRGERWRRWLESAGAEVIAMAAPEASMEAPAFRPEPLRSPARASSLAPDVGPALAWARAAATAVAGSESAAAAHEIAGVSDVVARRRLEAIVAGRPCVLRTAPPIRLTAGDCRRIAFVGATGAGKTTTLVKLACAYAGRGRRVALIGADAHRIGAFAQLLGAAGPLGVAAHPAPDAAHAARARAAVDDDAEIALIDLPGLHPSWEDRVLHVRATLAAARPHEIYLVASATASPDGVRATRDSFASLGATKLVLTRADEATPGQRQAVLDAADLPVAYVAFGPSAPGGIAGARTRAGARWLSGSAGGAR